MVLTMSKVYSPPRPPRRQIFGFMRRNHAENSTLPNAKAMGCRKTLTYKHMDKKVHGNLVPPKLLAFPVYSEDLLAVLDSLLRRRCRKLRRTGETVQRLGSDSVQTVIAS